MTTNRFSVPDLSQDQQDIFQKAFAKDLDYLKSTKKIDQSFYTLYVKLCKSSTLSILTEEEAESILQLKDVSEEQDAVLKSVGDKGPRAILLFYLVLNMNNEEFYTELPSSKENDEKLALISQLRDGFRQSLTKKVMEFSQHPRLTAVQGVARPSATIATVRPLVPDKPETEAKSKEEADSEEEDLKKEKKEIQKLTDSEEEDLKKEKESQKLTERSKRKQREVQEDRENSTQDTVDAPSQRTYRRDRRIRKDDEFFHFIIICFSFGAALISSYNYEDWTISAGIGLIAFASLETIGIYYGLLYRIRRVVDYLVPLLPKLPLPGLQKQE